MNKQKLGFIGLGAMGIGMAGNLLKAGYPLTVYDMNIDRVNVLTARGALGADSVKSVVEQSEIIVLSLPNAEVTIKVMEEQLLPYVREGQVILDMGTVSPPDTRRLSLQFQRLGVTLMDTPVAGGPGGAENGTLHIFAGGSQEGYERCKSILETMGAPEHVTYGGPSGNGQILKCVNQMIMGLTNAAYLESLAFGVLAGIAPATVRAAMDGEGVWRKQFTSIADKVISGGGNEIGVKFGQYPYFLKEAEEKGFQLPLSKALFEYCDPGERIVMEVNRLSPSYWKELTDPTDHRK
jgi:3-hydroxyisobutyrate dehydrogenase-like beta-hydroxyacid dehydrogenase